VTTPTYSAAAALRPLLEKCGYSGTRLATDFKVGETRYPLVGFTGKPWDFDSACIAVVEASGTPEDDVRKCLQLGAPVVWVWHSGTVDWWVQHSTTPRRFESKPLREFTLTVQSRHIDDLRPDSVYRAKVLGRLPHQRQLEFVDIGLMPLLRAEAGEKLGKLVEEMTQTTLQELGQRNPSRETVRNVFTCVFRLLAGKILKDKDVGQFRAIDLLDPSAVLTAVTKHYNATNSNVPLSRKWASALAVASEKIAAYGDVRVVSPESLAYVYEHTLVTKDLRKKLGIHATPPYLVDYVVWQLYDWIRDIPRNDRHVFEPACGHAPFLLAAMRMLRLEMQGETDRSIHDYLKARIHGIDVDDFALEIARLSLTLADIPNPDGWDLRSTDMYASNVLADEAAKCQVMFSNPPYESFGESDKRQYRKSGHEVRYRKAVEMLSRTLSSLPIGAVFGVVVPQTVLNGPEAREIRETLLRDFELAEICRFPGRVFEFAEMETAVVLGRRHSDGFDSKAHRVRLRSVGEHDLPMFVESYSAQEDLSTSQSRFQLDPRFVLSVPVLDELWIHLDHNLHLSDVAVVGRGIEFKSKRARNGTPVVLSHPRPPDYPAGFAGIARATQDIFTTPPLCGLAVKPELIENPRQGMPEGKAQVLVNRNRAARSRWRLKALLDPDGRPVKNNFLIVRPKDPRMPALVLWAILNSPIANAFIARDTMKRDNAESMLDGIPIPRLSAGMIKEVSTAAKVYRDLAARCSSPARHTSKHKPDEALLFPTTSEVNDAGILSQVCAALLAMDAVVLKAYGLPPRLERRLLDSFSGVERKGVGCTLNRYFPEEFRPAIPLWMYISEDFRRCRADYLTSRIPEVTDPELIDALAEVE
jgi:hypothetical protein